MKEIWKNIPNHIGYQASNKGRIRSFRAGQRNDPFALSTKPRILKQQILYSSRKGGHKVVTLCIRRNGKSISDPFLVHRLVLGAFIGLCPEKKECRHLDGNPAHNNLTNLCWGTHTENMQDMVRHGTAALGNRSPFYKLTPKKVKDIRRLHQEGISYRKLAAKFSVGKTTIEKIVERKKWKHIL